MDLLGLKAQGSASGRARQLSDLAHRHDTKPAQQPDGSGHKEATRLDPGDLVGAGTFRLNRAEIDEIDEAIKVENAV